MSEQEDVSALRWNNNVAVIITLVSYDYILQFGKEVQFVWEKQWSPMSYLYLAVRYLGIFIAMLGATWGGLMYMPESSYVTTRSLYIQVLTVVDL
ncbi:uncharacterized protein EDB91DRAFT_1249434 [Suillus paluster]|uniref:uncharacterized protein n=1 Tax=Suillus paluster TaxID=48578 RepID=UPI001B85F382|nr:uncharacterized protein EDB91DRAFT_1249434 [Suillus paluster]KAG1738118.1 hypothetical protein EDB91DRAFT_1249434 [Suillus paluster]